MAFSFRRSILFFLLLLLSKENFSQWIKNTNMIGASRRGAVSWVINNKMYVVGGGPAQDLQVYNTTTDNWTILAAVPWTTARYLGVGFVINGKGYICTGTDGVNGIYYNDLWMYDPATNVWTSKTSFPGAPRVLGFAFSIGSKAYVGSGGDDQVFYKDIYEYDSSNDSWTPKSDFPGGYRVQMVATSYNNEGYVGAGVEFTSGFNFVNHTDLYKYKASSDTWTLVTNIPGPGRLSAVCFASDSLIYTGLGTDNQTPTSGTNYADFYSYNPAIDVWDTLPAFPIPRSYATGAFADGKLYITAGGNTSANFSDLWSFELPEPPVNTTGISEEKVKKEVQIYPTIVADYATLKAPFGKVYDLKVINSFGEQVKEFRKLSHNSIIDCSDLKNGFYTVILVGERYTCNLKVVVDRK